MLDRSPTLAGLDPDAVPDAYQARGLDRLSDGALTDVVAAAVARPKVAAADSFVLHAPLELLARSALLPLVEPSSRPVARQRMVWLGATYQAAGEEVPSLATDGGAVPGHLDGDDPTALVTRLGAAIAAGELDDADRAAGVLAATRSPAQLSRDLTDTVLPRLSAAAHGNIALYQLPRIAPRSRVAATSVRGHRAGAGPPSRLVAHLAGAPAPGRPASRRGCLGPGRCAAGAGIAGRPRQHVHLPHDVNRGELRPGRGAPRSPDPSCPPRPSRARAAAGGGVVDAAGHPRPRPLRLVALPDPAPGRARVGRRRLRPVAGPRRRRHLCPGLSRHARAGRARPALGAAAPRRRRRPRRAGGGTGRGGGGGVARRPRHPRER